MKKIILLVSVLALTAVSRQTPENVTASSNAIPVAPAATTSTATAATYNGDYVSGPSNSLHLGGGYFGTLNNSIRQAGTVIVGFERFVDDVRSASLGIRGGVLFFDSVNRAGTAGAALSVWTRETSKSSLRARLGIVGDFYFANSNPVFNSLTGSANSVAFYTGLETGFRVGMGNDWYLDAPVNAGLFTAVTPVTWALNAGLQLGRDF